MMNVRLTIGCFDEKLTSFWTLVSGAAEKASLLSSNQSQLHLVFSKLAKAQIEVKLSDWFMLRGDFEGCGAKQITAFSDKDFLIKTTATDALSLNLNPAFDISVGTLILNSASANDSSIYLQAESVTHSAAAFLKSIEFKVSLCNDQPKALQDELQFQFL